MNEDDQPITPEAEADIAKYERRQAQGLANFPFDGETAFLKQKDGKDYAPHLLEVMRVVSGWYVKREFKYYDVENLQVSYNSADIKQVIAQKMRVEFPLLTLTKQGWADFFSVLLEPPVMALNPEQSIPVWSGKRVCIPNNDMKVIFENGVAVVNIWERPAYRDTEGSEDTAFQELLEWVIPAKTEREHFLNWLSWSIKNEDKKPKWAVMLHSRKQGTGKSTVTDVCKELFGVSNTARVNGVNKLVGRFNKEVLENKLVVVEEVELKRGSSQANSLKSLITEDSTMVEAKGMPAYVENIYCSFIMTTNHIPVWIEETDRRFFILDFDHDGHNNGGKDYKEFSKLVGRVYEQISTKSGVKGIYTELMARNLDEFNAMSLDVQNQSTGIMEQLKGLSPDVAKQQLEEILEEQSIVFVPVSYAIQLVNHIAKREVNSQTHLFSELGWQKSKFAWGGKGQKWCWHKPSEQPARDGKVWCNGNYQPMKTQERRIKMFLHPKEYDEKDRARLEQNDGLKVTRLDIG